MRFWCDVSCWELALKDFFSLLYLCRQPIGMLKKLITGVLVEWGSAGGLRIRHWNLCFMS